MAKSKFDVNAIRSQISSGKISNNELLAIYRRVAKTADQRLVRIEKLSQQKNFQNVKRYAYKKATMEALQWGANPNKPRFNIKPPVNAKSKGTTLADQLNRSSTRAKINDMLNFLEKPTSTKQGIIDIYQKRADTLNKNEAVRAAGLKFTWQDVGDFFESKLYKKMDGSFGSETRIKAIGKIKQNEIEILKAFKEDQKNHLKTADRNSATSKAISGLSDNDIVVQEAIKTMTSKYPTDVKKMLKLI